MRKYDDIINLEHPISKKHKQMSLYNRAAQFAPFAALTGYDDVIDETGRLTDDLIELDEYQKSDINSRLLYLIEHNDVISSFTYFKKDRYKKGGSYITVVGSIKKADIDNQRLIISDNSVIEIDSLISID